MADIGFTPVYSARVCGFVRTIQFGYLPPGGGGEPNWPTELGWNMIRTLVSIIFTPVQLPFPPWMFLLSG